MHAYDLTCLMFLTENNSSIALKTDKQTNETELNTNSNTDKTVCSNITAVTWNCSSKTPKRRKYHN